MRQALHIFKKDSRRFRYDIAVGLAWTIAFAIATTRTLSAAAYGPDPVSGIVAGLTFVILPVFWSYLIAQVVHEESLAGDRQFWVTRPYRRGSLAAAKAMFVAAYMLLPFAAVHAVLLVFHGMSLSTHLPAIAWNLLLVTVVVALPASAIAAVTTSLPQFVAVSFAVALAGLAAFNGERWPGVEWIRTAATLAVAAAVAGSVLLVQFARRHTTRARILGLTGVLGAVGLLAGLPWRQAFDLQTRMATTQAGPFSAELVVPSRGADQARSERRGQTLFSQLRFRVNGPASGSPFACDAAEVTIEGTGGERWSSGLSLIGNYTGLMLAPDDVAVALRLPASFSDDVLARPVGVRATLYITAFRESATNVPSDGAPIAVQDVGLCSGRNLLGGPSLQVTRVECLTAYRTPRFSAFTSTGGVFGGDPSYSPFPAELTIQPLRRRATNLPLAESVTIKTMKPIAHSQVSVDLRDIDLRAYLP